MSNVRRFTGSIGMTAAPILDLILGMVTFPVGDRRRMTAPMFPVGTPFQWQVGDHRKQSQTLQVPVEARLVEAEGAPAATPRRSRRGRGGERRAPGPGCRHRPPHTAAQLPHVWRDL